MYVHIHTLLTKRFVIFFFEYIYDDTLKYTQVILGMYCIPGTPDNYEDIMVNLIDACYVEKAFNLMIVMFLKD